MKTRFAIFTLVVALLITQASRMSLAAEDGLEGRYEGSSQGKSDRGHFTSKCDITVNHATVEERGEYKQIELKTDLGTVSGLCGEKYNTISTGDWGDRYLAAKWTFSVWFSQDCTQITAYQVGGTDYPAIKCEGLKPVSNFR